VKEFSEGYCKAEKKNSSDSLGTLFLEALAKVMLAYNHVIKMSCGLSNFNRQNKKLQNLTINYNTL